MASITTAKFSSSSSSRGFSSSRSSSSSSGGSFSSIGSSSLGGYGSHNLPSYKSVFIDSARAPSSAVFVGVPIHVPAYHNGYDPNPGPYVEDHLVESSEDDPVASEGKRNTA